MMPKIRFFNLFIALFLLTGISRVGAQGTAFTYQGRLNTNSVPANGFYDFQFALYNEFTTNGPEQIGSTLTQSNIGVTNGLFTTTLDFGDLFTGITASLAISVRSNGIGSYTPMTPRQVLTPTPYAVTAENLDGDLPVNQLSGTLLPAQLPGGVVTNYETSVTLGNVTAGNVTVGGNLNLPLPAVIYSSGNILLYADGNDNFIAGFNAGNFGLFGSGNTGVGNQVLESDSTGAFNDAEGNLALYANQSGSYNTANGANALEYNTTGSYNTGTGAYALSAYNAPLYVIGGANTADGAYALADDESGSSNTAVGYQALYANTSGSNNVGIGVNAFHSMTAGNSNVGLGYAAGKNLVTGSNNIYIGNSGLALESETIRIGSGQTATYVSGTIALDGVDTNNGLVYTVNSGLPGIDSGEGPFLYGFIGGSLGTVGPNEVNLSWDYLGNVWVSSNLSTATLTIRGGSDLAEPFKITSNKDGAPEGSVVVIDDENPGRLKVSNRPYDTRVAGVLSGANGVNPGIQMQQQGLLEGGKNVALTGRVYVQADASYGSIKPGDMLTTSATPGHAMKVKNHAKAQGAILGKAMSGLKQGKGMVLVLVTLQ